MKIALFVHCFFPEHFYGTETYTLEVARNLQDMGHDPIVVRAVSRGEPLREALVTRYDYEHIPVYCIDTNRFIHRRIRDSYYLPQLREVLTQTLKEIDPDLIHVTHLANHTAILLDVIQDMKIPVVATLTDFFGFCFTSHLVAADGSLCRGPERSRINCIECTLKATYENRKKHLIYRWLAWPPWRSLCAKALRYFHPGYMSEVVADLVARPDVLAERYLNYQAVIAPTRFLASAYKANGLKVPIYQMHFGVDIEDVVKSPVSSEAPLRFGFIGQLATHKGLDILVAAFCRLPRGRAKLSIFGSETQQKVYIEKLKEQSEGYEVCFCGTFPSSQMPEVLADIDFLVIPSRWYENSPLVLLGALASHTPVVASDVEGMAEFIQQGRNGYLFRRGSVDELEKVMRDLVENPAASRRLSQTTHYLRSTRNMTEDLVDLYDKVLRVP